jgi:hypothetical protein
MLSDKDTLELLDYWLSDQNNFAELPPNGKFTDADRTELFLRFDNSNFSQYCQHRAELKAKIEKEDEKKLEKIEKKENQKIGKGNYQINKFLLAVAILSLLFNGYQFLQSQQYNQKILPELMITSPTEFPIVLSAEKMADKGYAKAQMDNNSIPWERLEVCITNIGKTASGTVQIRPENDFLNQYTEVIQNIESNKQPSCMTLLLFQKGCGAPDFSGCDTEKLPKGKFKLKLRIFCPNCDPQVDYVEYNACIWHESGKECEN